MKPVKWMGSSKRDLVACSPAIQDVAGGGTNNGQRGGQPTRRKTMSTIGAGPPRNPGQGPGRVRGRDRAAGRQRLASPATRGIQHRCAGRVSQSARRTSADRNLDTEAGPPSGVDVTWATGRLLKRDARCTDAKGRRRRKVDR